MLKENGHILKKHGESIYGQVRLLQTVCNEDDKERNLHRIFGPPLQWIISMVDGPDTLVMVQFCLTEQGRIIPSVCNLLTGFTH